MDVLSESMRRATESGPPTGIDVDALIAGERRRRQRFTIGGSVFAVALVLGGGGVLLAPATGLRGSTNVGAPGGTASCALLAQPATTEAPAAKAQPSEPPQGTEGTFRAAPSEPAAAAEQRLSLAFDAALRAAAPGMTFADARRPDCPLVQFGNFGATFLYEGMALATDAGGTGGIAAHFYLRPTGRPLCDAAACSYDWIQDLPDGTIAFGIGENQAHLWRSDGTAIMILSVNSGANESVKRITLPVSRAQMIVIGTYPALTLFP